MCRDVALAIVSPATRPLDFDPHDYPSDFFHADFDLPDGCERHYLLPAGREENIDLLDQELMQGGKHRVYLKALHAAEPLFES